MLRPLCLGLTVLAASACIRMPPSTGAAPVAKKAPTDDDLLLPPFELKPEWSGPCARAETVDVDRRDRREVPGDEREDAGRDD